MPVPEVEQGATAKIYFEVVVEGVNGGQPFTPLNPLVDIFNPSAVQVVNDAVPTVVQTGLLRYNYLLADEAPLGVWRAHLSATDYQGSVYFEVVLAGTASSDPVDPLATLEEFIERLGYTPLDAEATRALHLLRSASALVRDTGGTEGDDWTAANVTPRIADITISVAFRAFVNAEALNQHTLGDENKGFDRAGVGGGEGIYLTASELKAVRKAAGSSSFRSVTLVTPFSGDLEDEIILAQ